MPAAAQPVSFALNVLVADRGRGVVYVEHRRF
jgi:hypothetical protein